MNDGLIDCFRHNTWASRMVLAACRDLTDEQLNSAVPGTYGSIIATMRHVIRSKSGYYRRLTGETFDWAAEEVESADIGRLGQYVDDLEGRWERFLSTPVDAERTSEALWEDGQTYVIPAGIVIAQAIHHGCEHRAQVCTTLTAIGAQAPELGVWEFSTDSGRSYPKSG